MRRPPNRHALMDAGGWILQSWMVYELLGLKPKAKLPAEGMEPREILGVKVWVTPSTAKKNRYIHRVMAECPTCKWVGSVGRLAQHVCKKEATSAGA